MKANGTRALGVGLAMLLCVCSIFAQSQISQDKVVLKNGREIKGFLVRDDAELVVINVGGAELKLQPAMIAAVTRAETSGEEEREGDRAFLENNYLAAITKYRETLTRTSLDDAARERLKAKLKSCTEAMEEDFRRRFNRDLRQIETQIGLKDYDQALKLCQAILEQEGIDDTAISYIKREMSEIHCLIAEDNLNRMRGSQALREIEKAQRMSPDFYRPYLIQADILASQNNFSTQTAQIIVKALELGEEEIPSSKYFDLNLRVARIYRDTGVRTGIRAALAKAAPYFEYCLKHSPDDRRLVQETVLSLERYARNYDSMTEAETERAVLFLQRAIELKPDRVESQRLLGRLYLHTRQYEKAIAQFQAVVEIEPTGLGNNLQLGRAYLENKDIQNAITYLRREYELDPENIEACLTLSDIYFEQKHYPNAIRFASRSLELQQKDKSPRYVVAESYFQLGRESYPSSRRWYRLILDENPDNLDALLRMAQMDMIEAQSLKGDAKSEHFKVAETKFIRVLEKIAKDTETEYVQTENSIEFIELDLEKFSDTQTQIYAECLTNLGLILSHRNDRTSAFSKHNAAIKAIPNFAKGYRNRGLMRLLLENPDLEKADADFQKAVEIDPGDPENYFALAQFNEKQDKRDFAINNYKQHIVLNGVNAKEAQERLRELGVADDEIPEPPNVYNISTEEINELDDSAEDADSGA